MHYDYDAPYAPPPKEHAFCEICGAELPGQEHIADMHDLQGPGQDEDPKADPKGS